MAHVVQLCYMLGYCLQPVVSHSGSTTFRRCVTSSMPMCVTSSKRAFEDAEEQVLGMLGFF